MKFRFLKLLLLAMLLATPAFAQSPSKIISQANKALGGEKALKAIISWQQTGKITRMSDGVNGKYAAMAAGGNLFSGMYDIGGFEVASGYNGKSGWVRDSKSGLRTLTGDAGKYFQAEALYRNARWLSAKKVKSKLTSGGNANIDGKSANIVILTTAKGVQIKLYFDAASGSLLREELPQITGAKLFDYCDYRVINGVSTPYSIKATVDGEVYEIRLDEVKYNQSVARQTFDFPNLLNEPLPDITALLNEIRVNADKVDEILENYSYTELRIDRDLGRDGKFVDRSSLKRLLTFYKGYRINRLIEKNGKPLSSGDQADEDKNAEKQVAEIEKKVAAKEKRQVNQRDTASGATGTPKGEGQRITIADALKGSLLTNPRRERFKGRDVIVFDYEPNTAFKPQTRNEKLFALCTGAVWVDAASKQVVRLEAVLTKGAGNFLAKAKSGASFSVDNELVNDEIWLPSQADVNLQIKILFAGFNVNNLIKYGDYRRFETNVKEVTVGDEKKP